MRSVLKKVGLQDELVGAGTGSWIDCSGEMMSSISPIDGQVIAKIRCADKSDYEKVVSRAVEAFKTWRMIPAPKRGEIVRRIRNALVRDRRVTLISATGSVAMGRNVGQIVAARLGKTILELGGNNAVIVTPRADLKMAVQVTVFGAVLSGGIYEAGSYVTPVICEVRADLPIVQEETFAPILYLIKYRHLEHAIAANNAVPQGLSSSIFTNDLREAESFLSQRGSDCGIANVNVGTSGAEIGGAFGGEKDTGGGREAGSDIWKSYIRRQTCTINWSGELPLAQGIEFRIGKSEFGMNNF